jgi:hypothetical protein
MPLYTFELRDGCRAIEDNTGVELPDRERAWCYACEVVRELMNGCEAQTRSWRLDVYEAGRGLQFKIPFAQLDRTLDGLHVPVRRTIQHLCDSYRSLKEVIHAAQATLRESRALVALSRGQPYLVTDSGVRTIRDRLVSEGLEGKLHR